MRTLYLLRHAKSDWGDDRLSDRERPLNNRGTKARELVADRVQGWPVDLVISSTARRAIDTAIPIVAALGCSITQDDALYGASAGDLLAVVRTLPASCTRVLLVGHNPGMEDLTKVLCGESVRYPTAAMGTVELDVDSWRDVRPGSGTLTAFVTPKQLRGRG